MPAVVPPPAIVSAVDRTIPGVWQQFLGPVVQMARAGRLDGVVITSWYRTPRENQRVGGAPESQHLWGLALDLWKQERLGDVAQALRPFMIVVPYSTHLHVQALPAGRLKALGFFPDEPHRITPVGGTGPTFHF